MPYQGKCNAARKCLDSFKEPRRRSRQECEGYYMKATQTNSMIASVHLAVSSRIALKSIFFYQEKLNVATKVSEFI